MKRGFFRLTMAAMGAMALTCAASPSGMAWTGGSAARDQQEPPAVTPQTAADEQAMTALLRNLDTIAKTHDRKMKEYCLLRMHNRDGAPVYEKHLLKDVDPNDPDALDGIVVLILEPDAFAKMMPETWSGVFPADSPKSNPDVPGFGKAFAGPILAAFAVDAAQHADSLKNARHGDTADTLAVAFFGNGDAAAAVAAETRALQSLDDSNADEGGEMKKCWALYQKAATAK